MTRLTQSLPPAARSRFTALQRATADAQAQRMSAVDAVRELSRDLQRAKSGEFQDDELARSIPEWERDLVDAQFAQMCRDQAWRDAQAVLNALEDWMATNISASLELATIPAPKLKAGETATAVLDRLRERIDALTAELRAAEQAPPLASELRPQVPAIVADLAEKGRPKIKGTGGALTVEWYTPAALLVREHATLFDHLRTLAWLFPNEVAARITAEIDAIPQDGALAEADKASRIADLNAKLFDAGLLEEGCIQHLLRSGQSVQRRKNADPRCLLGVQSKQRVAKAA